MTLYLSISAFINFIASLFLGLYLSLQGRDTQGRVFGLWCLSLAGWCFGYYNWQLAGTADEAMFWVRILMFAVTFSPVLCLHFTILFLDHLARFQRLIQVYYLVSLGYCVAAAYGPWLVRGVEPTPMIPFWPKPGPLFHPWLAMLSAAFLYSLVALWRAMRRTTGLRRNQIRYVLLAIAIAFGGGITNAPLWYGIPVPPVGHGLVAIYVLIIAYAIRRYRLLDLRVALLRTGLFLLTYTLVLGLPFGLAVMGRPTLESWLGAGWWVPVVGLTILLANGGPFLYLAFQRRAEDALLGEQRRSHWTLRRASEGMTQIRQLDRLLRLIVYIVTRAMRLSHAGIFLKEDPEPAYRLRASRHHQFFRYLPTMDVDDPLPRWLARYREPLLAEELRLKQRLVVPRDDAFEAQRMLEFLDWYQLAVIVPMFAGETLLGFLALGPKRSGQIYTQEDLQTFTTLANQSAVACENARFYETEARERQAALFHAANLAALGTLALGMSHQVNNRFNVVDLMAATRKARLETLLKKLDATPDELRAALAEDCQQFAGIEEEALRGGQVVASVNRITQRGQAGYKPLSVAEAVHAGQVVAQYKVRFDDFAFVVDCPESLPPIQGDLGQLGETFLNLIENAADAVRRKSRDRTGKPTGFRGAVRIQGRVAAGDRVEIQVIDNGYGIAPEHLPKLFIPFYTTKATTEKGAGLGLYVIKQIIEAHRGTILITSQPGEGTTVTLTFPRADVPTAMPS